MKIDMIACMHAWATMQLTAARRNVFLILVCYIIYTLL